MSDKPTFHFFIGAQRCGTTHLHSLISSIECFAAHDDYKEQNYFIQNSNGSVDEYIKTFRIPHDLLEERNVYVEFAPDYLNSIVAIDNLRNFEAEKKIFHVVLRQPVDRVKSQFHYERRNRIRKQKLQNFIENSDALERSRYKGWINTYKLVFGDSNVHVYDFDEIIRGNISEVLVNMNMSSSEIHDFEVEQREFTGHTNSSLSRNNQLFFPFMRLVGRAVRFVIPEPLHHQLKTILMSTLFTEKKEGTKVQIDQRDSEYLSVLLENEIEYYEKQFRN